MPKVYHIINKRTKEALNQKGGWSDGIKSYRVAEFASEAEAQAAFPAGIDCEVRSTNKPDEKEAR